MLQFQPRTLQPDTNPLFIPDLSFLPETDSTTKQTSSFGFQYRLGGNHYYVITRHVDSFKLEPRYATVTPLFNVLRNPFKTLILVPVHTEFHKNLAIYVTSYEAAIEVIMLGEQ